MCVVRDAGTLLLLRDPPTHTQGSPCAHTSKSSSEAPFTAPLAQGSQKAAAGGLPARATWPAVPSRGGRRPCARRARPGSSPAPAFACECACRGAAREGVRVSSSGGVQGRCCCSGVSATQRCISAKRPTSSSLLLGLWSCVSGMPTPFLHSTARESPGRGAVQRTRRRSRAVARERGACVWAAACVDAVGATPRRAHTTTSATITTTATHRSVPQTSRAAPRQPRPPWCRPPHRPRCPPAPRLCAGTPHAAQR